MPVAVRHHVYAGDVDPEEVGRMWQSWLRGLFV
jgi:hypothetical protein